MQPFPSRVLGASAVSTDWRAGNSAPWADSRRLRAVVPSDPWYARGLTPTLSSRAYWFAKRAVDVVAALLSLPLVIPILLLCALAIRIDTPGRPFFAQLRTGRGGRRFRMYKLRTMVQNAAELKEKYLHLNELSWPDFKITD